VHLGHSSRDRRRAHPRTSPSIRLPAHGGCRYGPIR
jgi:hypothetical protein